MASNQQAGKSTIQKAIEMQLIKNPKYSSFWIENASYLMEKYGMSEELLAKYNAEQLEMIKSVATSKESNDEIYLAGFLNPDLNATQMQIILTGYSHNLKTEQLKPFFNPNIPYAKANWAIAALCEGYDLLKYIERGYDEDQIYEIYAGLKDGVDVSVYDDISIPAEKMAVAHHAMVLGLTATFTAEPSNNLIISGGE